QRRIPGGSDWDSGVPRGNPDGADRSARVRRRQKGRAVVVGATVALSRADGEEAWHALVLGSQTIGDPRAHAGPHEGVAAGVQFEQGASMSRIRAVHGLDEADIVYEPGQLGKQVANPHSALAMLVEFPGRLEQVEGLARNHFGTREGQRLAVVSLEQRLVVESVYLGWATVHE